MTAGMRAAALVILLVLVVTRAHAHPPNDLDTVVRQLQAHGGAPGLAVAIVEGGHVTLARGWGVRALGGDAPVDADTLFEIGSTTKAFTAAALAQQVDAGALGWDDRVVDRLPGFALADPCVTAALTIRDLLTHRSGLATGAGDLMFWPRTTLSRDDIVRGLQYLPLRHGFRSGFAYDNLLYIVAGQVLARATGQSVESLMRARLLDPLGMRSTLTVGDEAARFAVENRARPHARLGPPMRGVGAVVALDERGGVGANATAAGGLVSSANDMARWVAAQLSHGRTASGARVWSEAAAREMWAPVVPVNGADPPPSLRDAAPLFRAYALGWYVQDYHGRRVVQHPGGTAGFLSRVVLLPDLDVGFVLLANGEDSELLSALQLVLLDHYAARRRVDWGARLRVVRAAAVAQAAAALDLPGGPDTAATPPSLPLGGYVGRYRDPWYGVVRIEPQGTGLRIRFEHTPAMDGALAHVSGDRFATRWRDPSLEQAVVSFAVQAGRVTGVTLRAASPLADFSFDYQDLNLQPVDMP